MLFSTGKYFACLGGKNIKSELIVKTSDTVEENDSSDESESDNENSGKEKELNDDEKSFFTTTPPSCVSLLLLNTIWGVHSDLNYIITIVKQKNPPPEARV